MSKAPRHLKPQTQKWFETVVTGYELEQHHVRILVIAAENWDLAQSCREILAARGLTYQDRFDAPRQRPEVPVLRDARAGFLRAIRELGLDVSEPEARPPQTQGKTPRR